MRDGKQETETKEIVEVYTHRLQFWQPWSSRIDVLKFNPSNRTGLQPRLAPQALFLRIESR